VKTGENLEKTLDNLIKTINNNSSIPQKVEEAQVNPRSSKNSKRRKHKNNRSLE
jgi:hypothetical protein